jgi:hypothetical protein
MLTPEAPEKLSIGRKYFKIQTIHQHGQTTDHLEEAETFLE